MQAFKASAIAAIREYFDSSDAAEVGRSLGDLEEPGLTNIFVKQVRSACYCSEWWHLLGKESALVRGHGYFVHHNVQGYLLKSVSRLRLFRRNRAGHMQRAPLISFNFEWVMCAASRSAGSAWTSAWFSVRRPAYICSLPLSSTVFPSPLTLQPDMHQSALH